MKLTPAELRTCNMLRMGLSTKEIAQILRLSDKTVQTHREHIKEKLEIRDAVGWSGGPFNGWKSWPD